MYMRKGFINKKIITLIGIVVVVLVAIQLFSLFSSKTTVQNNDSSQKMARLILDWGNGTKRAFEGETVSGMSVWHALIQSARAGNVDVAYSFKAPQDIVEIQKIGNTNVQNGEWVFFVNGKMVESQSVALTTITAGDVIEVKFVPR